MNNNISSPSKVCIVTGSASGIGFMIAMRLLQQGYAVAICDISESALADARDRLSAFSHARFFAMNVASEDEVSKTVRNICDEFGGIDVLVNNAGISDPENGPVEDLSLAEWNRRLSVNLTGPFLCSKYCTPSLKKRNGCIINISSTRSLMSEPNTEAYAASKGGLDALTHALAVSLGPEVRVNSVLPGWIDTNGSDFEKPLSHIVHSQHPAGRLGCPKDISAIVKFLISEEAKFITAQTFVIDGGMTKKMIYHD